MFSTNTEQGKGLSLMHRHFLYRKIKNKNLLSSLPWPDWKKMQKGINSQQWKEQEEKLTHGGELLINLNRESPEGTVFDY